MKRHELVRALSLILFAVCLTAAGAAIAENLCFHAMGRFESRILPPEECTAAICTQGKLIGSLSGEYEYIGTQLFPANEATIPYVMFYTGFSTVRTLKGDLYLTDAGALDFGTGSMSALLTVTGGTGEYGNAGGYLHVFGTADMQAGFVPGSFEGMVCR